jgi:transposase InsO family protein
VPLPDRQRILDLVAKAHAEHPSHGYRWIHAWLVQQEDIAVSADYIRRCFAVLGIESKTKHKAKAKAKARKIKDPYPNLVFSTWETVDRPRQVIVSDMTAFWTRLCYWELALYFDVLTKQIVGRGLTSRRGLNEIYYDGLGQAVSSLEDDEGNAINDEPCLVHTDQGTVYTSMPYNEIIKEKGLVRSCSRAGKPTDNPVNESLNGWIKEELFLDFGLYDAEDVPGAIDAYIDYYNSQRPSYSLGYLAPDEFYRRFMAGEIKHEDTFRDRVLDEAPKFVKKRKGKAGSGSGGSSGQDSQ